MDILIVMCLGVVVGKFLIPKKTKKGFEWLAFLCTFLLIFAMGMNLGGDEDFFAELLSLGGKSFLFFLIPTALSVVFVYFMTRSFGKKKEGKADRKEEGK